MLFTVIEEVEEVLPADINLEELLVTLICLLFLSLKYTILPVTAVEGIVTVISAEEEVKTTKSTSSSKV